MTYSPEQDPYWHDFARRYAATDDNGRAQMWSSLSAEQQQAFQKVLSAQVLPAPPPPAKKSAVGELARLLGLLAAVSVVVIGGLLFFLVGDTAPGPTKGDAYELCKTFTRQQLKAPSSAKFSPISKMAIYRVTDTEKTWQVIGHVDAPNSFGTMLRQGFVCTIIFESAEDAARAKLSKFQFVESSQADSDIQRARDAGIL